MNQPFAAFAPPISAPSPLRAAITAATRRSERECLAPLIEQARLDEPLRARVAETAADLIGKLRAKGQRGGVEGLVGEYSLSTQEGVALMCLAEALLRIPDTATRDALIRDKIAPGDWQAHLGEGRSLFVNAATWGLMLTGKLTASHAHPETGLAAALTRLIARAGEPVIRRGVDMAMELMGEQFVAGETIAEALARAEKLEARGFTHSFDMLGEAATTAADAARYFADYEAAIHAIGAASAGRGPIAGPGISIKLSALHPRYSRAQSGRVMRELLPRVMSLALLAKGYGIGLNIDAEEAERLELSLDLLEVLALEPALSGWNGLGFVVQAYGKRCPMVIDWLEDLARRAGRRIMVRLVKGAYWDAEIKRAQEAGLADFPVYTRKVHTDVAYLACARKLLAARDCLYPQFATHNAQTLASIHHLAGETFTPGEYEFQCLHGMGEALYEEVVGARGLGRPCRIYAPVGSHETLLAYLVRRLLENGANSSFVHRIWDENVKIEELAADPLDAVLAEAEPGAPHPLIRLPQDILGSRRNSAGIDLSDEAALGALASALEESAGRDWRAAPAGATSKGRALHNPADRRDIVGHVLDLGAEAAAPAMARALAAQPGWAATSTGYRAEALFRAADAMQESMPQLIGLIVREAGKSAANAIAEVREAIDFLRYYADQARDTLTAAHRPIGPIACISPWNFPLAIFTGQIAAALAAGNVVLAKPAEETPLIAAEAVRLLHAAGIPAEALQLLPGDGALGAALVAEPACAGVMFTGSTEVAKLIQAQLATRLTTTGDLPVLIAETGGQNAMVVDSSALAEQVVADVIASAFDSAGQRCSALRVLCLQEDVADRVLTMLKGALAELAIGNPDRLATDVGPVISAEAQARIEGHIKHMRAQGCAVDRLPLPDEATFGTFVAPTIIEIASLDQLKREVFGPVLHVLRYARSDLGQVIDQINATGYGLTFGLHTRIDETIATVTARARAGNVYINRNMIGAVVGVQPFGGRGLSGTGPKAGGPLYLGRLVKGPAPVEVRPGQVSELPGPVGERNVYALHGAGMVLLAPHTREGLLAQLKLLAAAGCQGVLTPCSPLKPGTIDVPGDLAGLLGTINPGTTPDFAAVLIERGYPDLPRLLSRLAAAPGAIPLPQIADADGNYRLDWLVEEVTTSTNTTAAGGNASLMALV